MMKKNGFTLAEVLITLAIIGVVATMTLPALMTNTSEQQYITGFKKGLNTLTEAGQLSQAIDGYGYEGLNADKKESEAQSLFGLLARRTAVDYTAGNKHKTDSGNYAVFLRDGSAILFPTGVLGTTESFAELEDDGLAHGIPILFDTNGNKGPNFVSNCEGKGSLAASAAADTDDVTACDTKANRAIKDIFAIRLRSNIAVPNGAAARWAFAK